jgi:hypothetical protein
MEFGRVVVWEEFDDPVMVPKANAHGQPTGPRGALACQGGEKQLGLLGTLWS